MRKFIVGLMLLLIGGGLGYGLSVGQRVIERDVSDHYRNLDETSLASNSQKEIQETLLAQSAAWNAGDIDGFMSDYWQSEALRFASGGNITYGWQGTLDGYKRRYPDKAAMGTLAFTNLDIKMLSDDDALVFGRWTLTRESDAPTGLFTLHVKNVNDAWKIVSDHTSSAD